MHVAARRLHVRRKTLVVLDVPGPLQLVEIVVALEFLEQLLGRLAEDVDQHVDAAAMGHADDDLADTGRAALLYQVVDKRDQALAALERESLLPDVARVQVALDALGAGQLLENPAPLLLGEVVGAGTRLEALAQPQTLTGPGDMRRLDTNLAAVDFFQERQYVAQLHALVAAARKAAGVELGIHVGLGQAEVVELQHAGHAPLHDAERINIGDLVPAQAVHLDET